MPPWKSSNTDAYIGNIPDTGVIRTFNFTISRALISPDGYDMHESLSPSVLMFFRKERPIGKRPVPRTSNPSQLGRLDRAHRTQRDSLFSRRHHHSLSWPTAVRYAILRRRTRYIAVSISSRIIFDLSSKSRHLWVILVAFPLLCTIYCRCLRTTSHIWPVPGRV